ncbi:glucose-1-phosphate adenylyltransferase [Methylobacter tundripaludum]|uniref:Glucose-1-phosphate adenylyltransferase n=1 Tax=Methylobacter tundripaludum (strain ATCC BAA-1195 / DSM 17260 / SV96) TaxID=697282 RepID=G3J1Z4_METTV|nr:glucose-1-phosphate adenylyltransferase [Methylobacter tundripaludum]EGW19750.1 Glucose-1-phosphate adenylyltransferase [Methylobacter tundripaludum SV96]
MLDKTLTIILAGGVGSRLHPLTADRAKPAVPFGGNYRIIDFTLSNCLHSGLRRMLVLTQYKSHSLQKHLRDGWSIFNPEISEYITPVPPQMRTDQSWYSGTADAIRQNLYLLERSNASHVLILSGDHIYRMDYAAMLQFHRDQGAGLTIACMPVSLVSASSFGIMSVDDTQRIRAFDEKPKHPKPMPDDPHRALASMGIYIFNMDLLIHELQADHCLTASNHDFGKDIIPRLIDTHCVCAYRFGGEAGRVTQDKYWRDVGTIDSYYTANMDLLAQVPPLDLYQPGWPIRTYHGQNPPARMAPGSLGQEGQVINSLLGTGTVVSGGTIRHSILFTQVQVNENAVVEDSILFDGVHVGADAHLTRCIVDKNVHIPPGERIGFNHAADAARFVISESGITVVPKNYHFLTNAPVQR